MQAKDVMTAKVIGVQPDASILHAIRLMLQNKVSGLPVIDGKGQLVGIISEGDLLRRVETGTEQRPPRWIEFLVGPGALASDYVHAAGRKVNEVMTTEVRTVGEDASLEAVVNLMDRYHIKRVPVVRERYVVGIITRANLLRAVAVLARQAASAPAASDSDIHKRLMDVLQQQPWAPVGMIDVAVSEGVVTLKGALFDERQRQALHVAAENIPGVKDIDDRLVWVDPASGYVVEAPPRQSGETSR
jgi:CBS domain-containing protein